MFICFILFPFYIIINNFDKDNHITAGVFILYYFSPSNTYEYF